MVIAFKREKLSGAWSKLRSEELHILLRHAKYYQNGEMMKGEIWWRRG